MKKLLLVFAFLASGLLFNLNPLVRAETVNVTTEGTLSAQLTAAGIDAATVTSLSVTGNINSTDIAALKTMATSNNLAVIDLSGTIISGNIIPDNAFQGCFKLTSITIPNSVTAIGKYAFYYCAGLTSVTIPNSVTIIGIYAFSLCSGLTSVTIPNSVTTIGICAFAACKCLISVDGANLNYSSEDGVLFSKDKTILIQCTNSKISYTIPNSVTTIGNYAFDNCAGLTTVIIPNSVTSIRSSAFSYCTGLTAVTIPNSVTTIVSLAFSYCTGLTTVNIPNSVTTIGSLAFSYCTGLTTVNIPNSVTTIGSYAFYYCTGLTTVNIPNSVTTIENSAFNGCSGLTIVTIPNSVTIIGNYAFYNCTGLTTVNIPNSVTSMGDGAFYNCSSNLVVNEYSSNAASITLTSGTFNSPANSKVVHIPAGSASGYTTKGWNNYFTIVDDLPSTSTLAVPTTVSLPCTGGNTATATITSNMLWGANVTTGADWLSVSPYSAGSGSNTITLTSTTNTSTTARTASITVATYDGTKSLTITVTQAGTVPVVTSQAVTDIGTSLATGNGTLTDLGSPAPTAFGICYSSTNTTPSIVDSKTDEGAATTTGAFTSQLTSLSPNTLYYACAYATNAAGTSYGSVVSFKTMPSLAAPANGDGTASNPYQIATLSDLYWLSQTPSVWSKYFIQTADIDASSTTTWLGGLGFSPIGNGTTNFTGNYNGQGHTISGMFISRYPDYYVALFGLASGATIQKLGVMGTKIEGEQWVGGIVGLSQNNTIIRECFSSFSNLKGEFMVGGIAGENNNSSIIHVYTFTSVDAYQYGGGITGFNQSGGSINFAYTATNVSTACGGGGALVGIIYDPSTVNNSFWNSNVMAWGGDISSSFIASPLTTAQMKVQSDFSNWDFVGETTNGTEDIWAITPDINNGYPCFTWQLSKPAVTTQAAIDITTSGATGRGNLSALGTTGYYPTAYGICYSTTNTTPSLADSKTNNGAASATGAFTSQLTALVPNNTYYARAYATNAAGTSYGSVVTFTTGFLGVTSAAVPANGTFGIGQNLDFTVNFTDNIFVDQTGGTPRIAITIGSTTCYANYVSGSGTSALTFRYTVVAGNADNNGIAMGTLSANGGSLKGAGGNDANLTLSGVGSTSGILVDAIAPAVSITAASSSTYGSVIPVTITFTKSVTGFTADDITVTNATKSNFTGSGTTYTFDATLTATNMVTIAIPASIAKDATGNDNTAATSINITVNKLMLTVNDPSLTLSKTYDGTSVASVTAGTISNKVTGDDVKMTATASYNDATVATGKTITVVYTMGGTSTANYSVPDNYVVSTGAITKAPLTIGITAIDKPYDGNTQATVTASITHGLVAGDDVSALASNGKFNNASVGNGKPVTADISISGTDASNYTFNTTATATASILDNTYPVVSFNVPQVNGSMHTSSSIDISFSEPVNMVPLALKNALVLRQENASGMEVSFTATNFTANGVSGFTITGNFECGKSYYIAVTAGAFVDLSGNPVSLTEKTFRTDPKPDSPVLSGITSSVCPGSLISVTNYTGSLSYQWQMNGQSISGQTSDKCVIEAPGKYSVMANNSETGCQSSSDTISVTVYPVVAPVIYEKKDQNIVSLLIVDNSANTFISYEWTLADDSSLPSDMVNNRQFLTVTGTSMNNQYKVRITDTNGCQAQSEITQIKAATASSLVYPTVNTGSFKINLTHPETGKVIIRIMSQTGLVIKQYLFYKELPSATFNVDMGHTVSGPYMVEISLGNYRNVKSVVVE